MINHDFEPIDSGRGDSPTMALHHLWAAVMLQAIEDLTRPAFAVDCANQRRYQSDALSWIMRRDDHRFNSFNGICRILGIDAHTARTRILADLKPRRRRAA